MKKILILMFAVFTVWLLPAYSEELTGRSIISEQQKRHLADNEFSAVELTITDRKGKEKKQEMVIYLSKIDGKTKSLIQYLAPANIRGVGLLTWEQEGDHEDDQWMYLSAARKVKRIAGGNKKNQFMGTDMAFEDMRVEDMETHAYALLENETVSGKPCWKIEATPSTEKEKKESGYGKRIMWVDQSNYYTLKMDFFDHHDRHIKTALFDDVRHMNDTLFRSFKITWERHRKKTSTTMIYGTIDIDSHHKNSLFTQSYMKRPVR